MGTGKRGGNRTAKPKQLQDAAALIQFKGPAAPRLGPGHTPPRPALVLVLPLPLPLPKTEEAKPQKPAGQQPKRLTQ